MYKIEVIIDAGDTRHYEATSFDLSGGILTINTSDGSSVFNFDNIVGYTVITRVTKITFGERS